MYYKLGIELVFPNVAPKNGPLRKRKGFPGGSHGKESACNAGDPGNGLIALVGKIPWRREWLLTQYSGLENFMDRGAWQATVHGVTKSWTQLSDFHFGLP